MRSGKRGWKTSQLSDCGRAGLEVAPGRWNSQNHRIYHRAAAGTLHREHSARCSSIPLSGTHSHLFAQPDPALEFTHSKHAKGWAEDEGGEKPGRQLRTSSFAPIPCRGCSSLPGKGQRLPQCEQSCWQHWVGRTGLGTGLTGLTGLTGGLRSLSELWDGEPAHPPAPGAGG